MSEEKMNSVLIVDDQETTITLLKDILNKEYTVYTAENGADAINEAERLLPDIILLDILMIDMDGYTVLAELKKSSKTKAIPIIFISSLSGDVNEARGLSLGAVDYITKPFSPGIVKLRVRNQIMLLEQFRTIERLGMIDQLTDIPNRRSFERHINSEWGRALRDNTAISILLVDLDLFRKYNDAFGHEQGDAALVSIAKLFSKVLRRPADYVARWDGGVFVVLLPNTDLNGALEMAEKIRSKIEDMEIPCSHSHIPAGKVTVSIGVNTREPGQGGTVNEFISRADAALYEAKDRGRNRIFYYGEK